MAHYDGGRYRFRWVWSVVGNITIIAKFSCDIGSFIKKVSHKTRDKVKVDENEDDLTKR